MHGKMTAGAALSVVAHCRSRVRYPEPLPRNPGEVFCLDICTYYFAWKPVVAPVEAPPGPGSPSGQSRQRMSPMHSSSFSVYGYFYNSVMFPLCLFIPVSVSCLNLRYPQNRQIPRPMHAVCAFSDGTDAGASWLEPVFLPIHIFDWYVCSGLNLLVPGLCPMSRACTRYYRFTNAVCLWGPGP
jgi:hypothetical protein